MNRPTEGRHTGLCIAVLLLTAVSASMCEPAIAPTRTVTVGVYENPPKIFINESGNPAGIFIDILNSIAETERWELRFVPGTWSEGLERLSHGEIDLMPDVAYSSTRDEIFYFHDEPVLSDWFQVYAEKDSGIESIVDLDGKRVVVLERSVQQAAFERAADGFDLDITLIPLPDYYTIFQRVSAGGADAAITNRFFGVNHADKYSLEDTAVIFHPTRLYFAASEGRNRDLLQAIDRHLRRMKKNPRSAYYESIERWTSEEQRFSLPAWITLSGLIAVVVLLTSLTAAAVLKRQVDIRTWSLRISERRLIDAQRIAKMGYFTWEIETGKVAWSDTLFDLLKYTKTESFDCDTVHEKIHHPEDRSKIGDWLSTALSSAAHELTPNEYRVVCRDGEVKYIRTVGKIERDKGKPVRVFATVQDITDRKQTEEELRILKDDLERQVSERTGELERKVEKLDKSQRAMLYMVEDLNQITAELKAERRKLTEVNRELEAFSYSVSHDLRTPLRAIDGFSGIIEEEYAGVLDEEGLRLLRVVRDNTAMMDHLISDLLELSRTGRLEMNFTKVDMTSIAWSMYHEVVPEETANTFEFTVDSLPKAYADPTLIKRVWSNLIGNAVKYTMPKKERTIEISGDVDGERCMYSIKDSGVGFDQAYEEKLFNLFQRLHTAEEFEGTGVGLAIVRRIIHRHGGTVWAEGRVNEGAVFHFSLPRKPVNHVG